MPMMTIVCPKCSGVAKLSLAEGSYSGPRRCWKCHEFFTVSIENNRLISCEPLSQEEYEQMEAARKAAEKSPGGGGGIQMSRRAEPNVPKPNPQMQLPFQDAPAQSHGGLEFSKQTPAEPSPMPTGGAGSSDEEHIDIFQQLAGKSKGGSDSNKRDQPAPQNPPPAKRDFYRPPPQQNIVPTPAEPGKPAIFPPLRINTFVPIEDIKDETPKPKKEKKNNDMFNPFIPPQT